MWHKVGEPLVWLIIGAVVGLILQVGYDNYTSARLRKELRIPAIINTQWNAKWLDEDGRPLPDDTVTFAKKWTKNNLLEGKGAINYPSKTYNYNITGEMAPERVLLLSYKAEDYPTEAHIGTVCLRLSGDGRELAGYWIGFNGNQLQSGKVSMHRVR
jgi:hypothetical protein